jgi:hypothetical protein
MTSFKQFILEGGNVMIGDKGADRIDLTKINRDAIVPKIDKTLEIVNATFKKKYGLPLWSGELFKSKKFLSGSAFHFFNRAISTPEFTKFKNTVGDIDTQVDKMEEKNIEAFLKSNTGHKFGDAHLIGFKKSAGQFITLWHFIGFDINIQIDMELVDFAHGNPTDWSMFSHSSSWNDIASGIKGVFHKYLVRAFSSKTLRDIIILKGKKEVPTKTKATDLAFSVTAGLRIKIAPVFDAVGKHEIQGGLYVYREIATNQSSYVTDLAVMFEMLFNHIPSKHDLDQFDSFIGGAELVKKYFAHADQVKLIGAFAHTLWGKGAQGIYRGDGEKDNVDKMAAFTKLTDTIGVEYDKHVIDNMRADYYKSY